MLVSIFFILILWILLIVGATNKISRSNSLISCYNCVIGLCFVYFALPITLIFLLNGGSYVWLPALSRSENVSITALVCILAAIAFMLGYYPGFNRKIKYKNSQATKYQIKISILLILVGVFLKIYVWMASGSVDQNFIRLSGGIRDAMDVEALPSHLIGLRNLSGMADAGITWLLLERMRSKKSVKLALSVFIFFVVATYLGAGKRLYVLWPLIAVMIGFHSYVRPIEINKAPIIAFFVICFGFLTLMARIYLPAFFAGVDINLTDVDWANGSLFKFYFFSLEFSTYEFLTLAIYKDLDVISFFGSNLNAFWVTNIEPFFYSVPRVIWPGKPMEFFDLSHAYRAVAMGGELSDGGGIAVTIIGTTWTLAGPLGLVVSLVLLGRACRWLDRNPRLRHQPSALDICWYAYSVIAVFHLFRQGTLGWTFIIVVVQHSGILIGMVALTWARVRNLSSYQTITLQRY